MPPQIGVSIFVSCPLQPVTSILITLYHVCLVAPDYCFGLCHAHEGTGPIFQIIVFLEPCQEHRRWFNANVHSNEFLERLESRAGCVESWITRIAPCAKRGSVAVDLSVRNVWNKHTESWFQPCFAFWRPALWSSTDLREVRVPVSQTSTKSLRGPMTEMFPVYIRVPLEFD